MPLLSSLHRTCIKSPSLPQISVRITGSSRLTDKLSLSLSPSPSSWPPRRSLWEVAVILPSQERGNNGGSLRLRVDLDRRARPRDCALFLHRSEEESPRRRRFHGEERLCQKYSNRQWRMQIRRRRRRRYHRRSRCCRCSSCSHSRQGTSVLTLCFEFWICSVLLFSLSLCFFIRSVPASTHLIIPLASIIVLMKNWRIWVLFIFDA